MSELLLGATLKSAEAISEEFRQWFFRTLDTRQLAESQRCLDEWQTWLTGLEAADAIAFDRDRRHYQAILYFERRQFDQAERIRRQLLIEDLSALQRARVCNEMGPLLSEQGLWREAEQFLRKAIAGFALIDHLPYQARAYNNLGTLITYQVEQGVSAAQRLQEAIECHERALALLAQLPRDEALGEIAHNWHGLGVGYGLAKNYAKTEETLHQHILLCQEMDDSAEKAIGLSDLAALLYLPLNQLDAAQQALDEAITHLIVYDDLMHLAEALARRGHLWTKLNEPAKALADFDAAIQAVESIRNQIMTPAAQAAYRAMVDTIYTARLSFHLSQGNYDLAFTSAEQARSRVLADLLVGQIERYQADVPQHLLVQRNALRQQLEQINATEADPAERQKRLESVTLELSELDRQIELLRHTEPMFGAATPLTVEEVRQCLPANSAILTYVSDVDARLWALIVTPERTHAQRVAQFDVKWLHGFLLNHLSGKVQGQLSLKGVDGQGSLSPPNLYPPLYEQLIAPIAEHLTQARTIYIIPTGPLHYIPLGALTPAPLAPPSLLTEGRRVVYAPSATILLQYCRQRPVSPHSGVLAIAHQDAKLKYIHGAAQTIARIAGGEARTGADATRQVVLTESTHYRVLCFLSHALFNPLDPMLSHIKLAENQVLQANEILRELRLQADLVVLAACSSGRIQVLRGDEILGLSRALLYAGAPSLLVTLWMVHEIPTRLLMEEMFTQLKTQEYAMAQLDPALTLAAAQRWLRELTCAEVRQLMSKWDELSPTKLEEELTILWQMTHPSQSLQEEGKPFAHPFFWSPFILIGDQGHGE